jgi:hypothetical protein
MIPNALMPIACRASSMSWLFILTINLVPYVKSLEIAKL